jgi:putative flippase GtrA
MSVLKIARKIKTFLIIGLIAVGIDYFVYSTLATYEYSISFSKALGFILGTSFSFAGNMRYTFESTFSKSILIKYFLIYFCTMNLNIILNNTFLNIFIDLEFKKQISFIFTTAFCAGVNFISLNYIFFKKRKIVPYE